MDQLKNLPRPVQIAVPVVILLVLAFVLMQTAFKGSGMVTVAHSADRDQVRAWVWKLKSEKMSPTVHANRDTGEMEIRLPAGSEDKTAMALDVDSKIGVDTVASCKAPGQFGSNAAQDAYDKCVVEHQIHDQLLNIDSVLEASVQVSSAANDSLTGSDTVSKVTITLFTDPSAKTLPDGRALALKVANMAEGATPDTINISTNKGDLLWQKGSGTAGTTGTAAGAAGCDTTSDVADMDITSKERMVKACIEQEILHNISTIVGGAQNAQVIVNPTLSPEASSQTVTKITRGALLETNEQSSNTGAAGSKNTKNDFSPNKTELATQRQAGYLNRLAISVFLNSREVTPATENAIRAALTQYVDTRRGDPAPVVRSFMFSEKSLPTKDGSAAGASGAPATGGTGDASGTGATGTPGTASGASTDANGQPDAVDQALAKSPAVPAWAIIAGAGIGLVLLMTILIMWRRNARLAKERKLFEQEFRNDARMFEDYSRQNPDVLAQQLNDLFAQPSAPVR